MNRIISACNFGFSPNAKGAPPADGWESGNVKVNTTRHRRRQRKLRRSYTCVRQATLKSRGKRKEKTDAPLNLVSLIRK